MAYLRAGEGPLDYAACRYGKSRLLFRGPRRDTGGRYAAFLGGTETYGRFVRDPFPALCEGLTGLPSVNLGCPQAGPEAWLADPGALEVADRAAVVVVQVTGAQNLSNRLYAVHPRRNDRFLRASATLRALYPEVDFTEFAFTRHMLSALALAGPDRFGLVAQEVRMAWAARMQAVLDRLRQPPLLLWMAAHPVPARAASDMTGDPLFVDRPLLAALSPRMARLVEVVVPVAGPGAPSPAAAALPGPEAHRIVAERLAPILLDHV